MTRFFAILFLFHLILIAALVIFLAAQGIPHHRRHFHPPNWFPPLLTSTLCAAALSLLYHSFAASFPSKAFKTAFWLGPVSTFALALLLLAAGSSAGLAAGIAVLICSVVLSLYGCWASPRFKYAVRVLTVSGASPPPRAGFLIMLAVLVAALYSSFLAAGVGGARAGATKLDTLFVVLILLSAAWTLQVIRNVMFVSAARVKFAFLTCGAEVNACIAVRDTLKHSKGSVCVGSILVPVLGAVWGSARAMRAVAGDADEFLFSCTGCCSGVASSLVTYANRWGFVHVGVYNRGFVESSAGVWDMFKKDGLEEIIDSDLTGSLCFLSGVAVGAICSLVSGSWAMAVHKNYVTELSLYTFFIGYFLGRIGMAWQQACLAAYYVAYAESGGGSRFDATIPSRIQELQRAQA